ncbi:MAG: radical SAM protein [Nanoarchaeota archaeon]|nr:radical SAM protein [Nanoarchaeota archaeon]
MQTIEKSVMPAETREKFQYFLNRGQTPYNYEKQFLRGYLNLAIEIINEKNPVPYELEIQPTSQCNAFCNHCFGKNSAKIKDKINSREAMDIIVKRVLDFKQDGYEVEKVKFCGSTGEPLMNPFTPYAISEFYNKKYLRLFTNGIKLAENKNNIYYLKILSKVNNTMLSLDAGTTETLHKIKPGSKNIILEDILATIKPIKDLAHQKIEFDVSYVITQDNYSEIIEATKKVKEAGADLIRFRIDLTDRLVSEQHSDEIINKLNIAKEYGDENFKVIPIHSDKEICETDDNHFSSRCSKLKCFTSKLWTCIGSDGNLYPCGHMVDANVEKYGNIFIQNLNEIWNSQRKKELNNKLPLETCHTCSPFSLRINEFMTFLSELPKKEAQQLVQGVKK